MILKHNKRGSTHHTTSCGKLRGGFSLIEIIIVAAITVILSLVGLASLIGSRSRFDLDDTAKKIAATLREAQSRGAAEEGGATWGVHFDNNTSTPFYALFRNSYSPASEVGHYRLPVDIRYATTSVAQGGSLDTTFSTISGAPSASSSITINLTGGGGAVISSSTIYVAPSGLIGF